MAFYITSLLPEQYIRLKIVYGSGRKLQCNITLKLKNQNFSYYKWLQSAFLWSSKSVNIMYLAFVFHSSPPAGGSLTYTHTVIQLLMALRFLNKRYSFIFSLLNSFILIFEHAFLLQHSKPPVRRRRFSIIILQIKSKAMDSWQKKLAH